MKIPNIFAALLLVVCVSAGAQTTRTWKQSSFTDFEKGVSCGVAIRSDGVLELAHAFRAVATTPSSYIWAIASDSEGNLLAATGAPARVYRITPQGQLSTLLQPAELEFRRLRWLAMQHLCRNFSRRQDLSHPAKNAAHAAQSGEELCPATPDVVHRLGGLLSGGTGCCTTTPEPGSPHLWYVRGGRELSFMRLIGQHELEPDHHPKLLITFGVHRLVRHPLYLGHVCTMIGFKLGAGTPACFALLCLRSGQRSDHDCV